MNFYYNFKIIFIYYKIILINKNFIIKKNNK